MRIVQALGSSGRGGAELFFTRLAKALDTREVTQVLLARRKAWAVGQLESEGVAVQTAWFGGRFDIVTRAKYRRTLRALRANVAINWMPHAAAACPPGPWVRVARLGKCYPLAAFANADHLIANSPRIAAHMEAQGWPASRLTYIPNFVPEIPAGTGAARRGAFNTPEDAPLLLWIGRMSPTAGPDLAVRALAGTRHAYLWMAGAGAYEDGIKSLAAQMGVLERIRFFGWQDDLGALLKAADIYIRSSRGEGLGHVLDAWANGLPAVASQSMDCAHLISNGETGLLVPKEDPEAMALALNAAISNRELACRIGQAGKAQFRAHFSEASVAPMYLDLCRRLTEEYAWRMKTIATAKGPAARPAPA